jgi:adenylate cyclase
MLSASRGKVVGVVRESVSAAVAAIDSLTFERKAAATMLAALPRYARLRLGSAVQVWTATLFVDLRDSTKRAQQLGPRNTFLTMHALLPALAYLTGEYDGYVVGFRGDGLFAAFGLRADGENPSDLDLGMQVQRAAVCGQTMIEAVRQVVNPILREYDVPGNLRIGVGIDCGQIVITRIGLSDGYETTAYGDSVNGAAKLSGADGMVLLSHEAYRLYPHSPDGKVTFEPDAVGGYSGYRPHFPMYLLID